MNSASHSAGLMALLVAGSMPATPAAAQSAGPGLPVDKPAEQVYANITALNGLPYGEVIAGMQVMSEALGVGCEHCHARSGDRDLDANPLKDVARQMIRMVRGLNREHFGGRNVITCYTCHRGSPLPEAQVSLPVKPDDGPTLATAAEGLPGLQALIDRYTAAAGGDSAVIGATRIEQGRLTIVSNGHQVIPFEIISQAPDRRRTRGFTVSHLGNSAQAFAVVNGAQGWMRESSGPVRWMFGWRRDAAQLEDLLNLPRRLRTMVRLGWQTQWAHLDGRRVAVLYGSTEHLARVELHFDPATGLLLRTAYEVDTAAGRMPSRIDYSDYRAVDGVMVPFRWEVALVRGVRVTYQLESVKRNVEVDEGLFALPSPAPALYR